MAGGPFGPFDLPAVRDFIRLIAPRRGGVSGRRRRGPRPPDAARTRGARGTNERSPPWRPTDERAGATSTPEGTASWPSRSTSSPLPGMIEGPPAASIPGRVQEWYCLGSVPRPASWASAVIGAWTTRHSAGERGWCSARSRLRPLSTRSAGRTRCVLLDPAGEVFRQSRAVELAGPSTSSSVCARYEGVDDGFARWSTPSCRSATTSCPAASCRARRNRRGAAAAAGRIDERRRRGVVLPRPPRVPAVHPPAVVPWREVPRSSSPAITAP